MRIWEVRWLHKNWLSFAYPTGVAWCYSCWAHSADLIPDNSEVRILILSTLFWDMTHCWRFIEQQLDDFPTVWGFAGETKGYVLQNHVCSLLHYMIAFLFFVDLVVVVRACCKPSYVWLWCIVCIVMVVVSLRIFSKFSKWSLCFPVYRTDITYNCDTEGSASQSKIFARISGAESVWVR